jgi:glyoxalase superfamily protein
VTRLERLGTQRVERVHHWWVMHDPAGSPFCVLPGPPAMLTGHNALCWD